MDAIKAILTRRSIRKYTSQPVGDATITSLLKAAMAAPSAGNQQPWHFIVIKDRQTLARIPEIHPHSSMVPEAAAAILICSETEGLRHPGHHVQDCAAATQNVLLAAHAQGLGAVWLGIHPREERIEAFQKMFGLPDRIMPISMVSLGHPAEEKPPANRFEPSKIRYEHW